MGQQHPEDWWRATCVAVRKAIASAKLSVGEVSCASAMHGAVMLDERRASSVPL